MALKEVGVTYIVSFSVSGVLNRDYELGKVVLVDDLMYPDNRLPDGSVCSFFDTAGAAGRGHLIAGSFYNSQIIGDISEIMEGDVIGNACYAYSVGPRFNSK